MSTETRQFRSDDPRLDWVMAHDTRSENFPVRAALGQVEVEPRTWRLGPVLDQGLEGACVGFGWTGELIASPRPDPTATFSSGNWHARQVYAKAKRIDEWAGEDYEGTSVLAGAKVLKDDGHITGYRWAFSIDDVRDAVISEGPVVIGVPWFESMYHTRDSGLVEISGDLVGGHCILVHGYHPSMRISGEDWHARFNVFRWRNSWGYNYGVKGSGLIRYEDLRDLLDDWGEACVPMNRTLVRLGV